VKRGYSDERSRRSVARSDLCGAQPDLGLVNAIDFFDEDYARCAPHVSLCAVSRDIESHAYCVNVISHGEFDHLIDQFFGPASTRGVQAYFVPASVWQDSDS
jgi:hypothetical protein